MLKIFKHKNYIVNKPKLLLQELARFIPLIFMLCMIIGVWIISSR